MVLGAVYTLWSFNRIFFGNLSVFSVITFADLNRKEFALFFPLVISLFSIGLYPTFYLNIFFYDSIRLLEHADIHRQKNL
jgi:NADH-quinone oxidoreductase subunit M